MSGLPKLMIKCGLRSKNRAYERQGFYSNPLLDSTCFLPFRKLLGGNVRLIMTGSAAIHPEHLKFLRLVFGCPIVEGYGLAESCAASFVTQPGDTEVGHVGGPTPTVEVKLVDLPDIGYFSYDVNHKGEYSPRGEICLRGPTLFKGYYKDDERTNEVVDSEGFFHTGDIAVRLPHNGAFKLIDRIQGVFKLSNGEFIAANKLELTYGKSRFINQIYIHGDSSKPYLTAIVVPNEDFIRKYWAPHNKIDREKSLEEFCQLEKLKEDILSDMEKKACEDGLAVYEAVKKIHLEPFQWTTEDLLTSSHKTNRKAAHHKYSNILDRLWFAPELPVLLIGAF